MMVIVIVVVVEKSRREGDENGVVKMVVVTLVLSLKLSPKCQNGCWRCRRREAGWPKLGIVAGLGGEEWR